LPFLRDSSVPLKHGLATLQNQSISTHPVQHIQKNWVIDEASRENFAIKRIFGTQMNMRLEMEKEILGKPKRLPGLPSSFVGLETVLGTDEDIDFEDYLSDPRTSETIPPSTHEMMETSLGIQFLKL